MSEDSRVRINIEKERRNQRGITVLICLFVIVCLGVVCCCYISPNLLNVFRNWFNDYSDEGKIGKTLLNEGENWEILLYDDFEEDKDLWWEGANSDEYGIFENTIEDGVYRIDVTANKGFYYRKTPDFRPVSDFYLTVEIDKTIGPLNGDYGVVFREMGSSYYHFIICDSGTFVVRIRYSKEWERLKGGNYYLQGGDDKPRKITVIAKGSNFYFFIDDQFVTEIEDDRLPSGDVGISFGLHDAGEQAVFEFDNFELRVPEASQISFSNDTDEGKTGNALFEEAKNWEVKISDDFEEDKQLWEVGTDSGEFGVFTKKIEDGVYRIDALAYQGFYYSLSPDIHSFSDFFLSVEADKISGPDSGDYGIVFREMSSSNYNFTIYDSGTFVVRIRYKGEWERLKEGHFIPKGGGDKPRKISVIAKGSHFYFFVDDQFVAHIEDARVPMGYVGATFGMDDGRERAVFEFDNFELRVPEK